MVEIGNCEAFHPPLHAAIEGFVRLLGKKTVFVRERGQFPALQRWSSKRRRNFALGEIDLLFGEAIEGRGGNAEILGQQLFRRVTNPVANTEGAEFGEITVVEHQDEVARLVAERFDDMAMTAREIPDIARREIVGFGATFGIDDGGAYQAFDHEGPFRRRGVPMKLAHDARLHAASRRRRYPWISATG